MARNGSHEWKETLREEIASLRTLRDELRVKAHLGAKDAAGEVSAAVRLLASTVRDAYGHIKAAV